MSDIFYPLHIADCSTGITRARRATKLRESQQIRDAKKRAPFPESDLRIGRDERGPVPWNGATLSPSPREQESRAVPVVPFADADELASAQRVKRDA